MKKRKMSHMNAETLHRVLTDGKIDLETKRTLMKTLDSSLYECAYYSMMCNIGQVSRQEEKQDILPIVVPFAPIELLRGAVEYLNDPPQGERNRDHYKASCFRIRRFLDRRDGA